MILVKYVKVVAIRGTVCVKRFDSETYFSVYTADKSDSLIN